MFPQNFVQNYHQRDFYLVTTLTLLALGIVILIIGIVGRTTLNINTKTTGVFTMKILLYSILPFMFLPVYYLLYHSGKLSQITLDRLMFAMTIIIVLHTLLFTLGSAGAVLHTFMHYKAGQVCGWNNLLLGFMIVIMISEYILLGSGKIIMLPESTWGMVGMWFYWVFVLGFILPMLTHANYALKS